MARGPLVLVIDDDPAMRTLVRRALIADGCRVDDAAPSPASLAMIAKSAADLLILDIDSPICGGPKFIEAVRQVSAVPIVALAGRDDEAIIVAALRSGADDVIRAPFNVDEMLARAESVLRRRAREQGKGAQVATGDLQIDLLHRRVLLRGQDVRLSAKPYDVLKALAESAGKALTHGEILHAVWGDAGLGKIAYVRIAIRELRRRLEDDPRHPRYILTENRVGYRLEVQRRFPEAANIAAAEPLKGTIDRQ